MIQPPRSLPLTEFARRLCVAQHSLFPSGNTAHQPAPCSQHIVDAQRYWGLIQPAGRKALDVIMEAAGVRPA